MQFVFVLGKCKILILILKKINYPAVTLVDFRTNYGPDRNTNYYFFEYYIIIIGSGTLPSPAGDWQLFLEISNNNEIYFELNIFDFFFRVLLYLLVGPLLHN